MKPIHALSLAGLMLAAAAPQTVVAREDWRYMGQWMAIHSFSAKLTLSALAEVYLQDDISDDYCYDGYLTCTRQLGHGFGAFGQLYVATAESDEGAWATTGAVVGGATHTTDIPWIGRLKLQERVFCRVDSPGGWDQHRPRIYLSREFGPWSGVVSDEMRLDLSGDRERAFFRNRLFATVLWKATETLTLGLGYFRQWDREDGGGWSAFNGVQTVMTIAL